MIITNPEKNEDFKKKFNVFLNLISEKSLKDSVLNALDSLKKNNDSLKEINFDLDDLKCKKANQLSLDIKQGIKELIVDINNCGDMSLLTLFLVNFTIPLACLLKDFSKETFEISMFSAGKISDLMLSLEKTNLTTVKH